MYLFEVCSYVHKYTLITFLSNSLLRRLTLVVVVGESVDGARGNAAQDALVGGGSNVAAAVAVGNLSKTHEVGGETSNVGSSHGGTRDASHATTDPGGLDISTGGEDINGTAVVGEAGAAVVAVGGANGADRRLRSGRGVGSISVVVSGGDSDEDTRALEVRNGVVDRLGVATTERHRGNNAIGAVAVAVVVGNIVHAGDDGGELTGAIVVKDLDTVDGGLLGDTVGLGANGTRAVSAVAVTIALSRVVGLDELGTALELGVSVLNTSVDHVGAGASAGGVVVVVGGGSRSGAGDAGKSPRSVGLRSRDSDNSILFNVLDLFCVIIVIMKAVLAVLTSGWDRRRSSILASRVAAKPLKTFLKTASGPPVSLDMVFSRLERALPSLSLTMYLLATSSPRASRRGAGSERCSTAGAPRAKGRTARRTDRRILATVQE